MYLIDANILLEVLYKKANGKNATNSLTTDLLPTLEG